MEVTAPPQSTTTASTALPDVPQISASEMDNDPAVKSAITFLKDPRVKNTPMDRRLTFLRNKGLTPAQIRHACTRAGIQVTEEQILKLPTQSQAEIASAGASAPAVTRVQNPYKPAQAQPPSVQTQMLYPHAPPPEPEPVPAKSYDWRDIVIGTGAAVLAGFGGYKLFQRYSPYELRRKSEVKATRGRPQRPGARRPMPRSSGSDTDTVTRAPPLPPAPAEPPKPQKDDEEVKRLETELSEAKEALASERKRAADLAVNSAKSKSEKQQLVRANDRLTEQVDELKAKVEELEKSLEAKNQTGSADTAEPGTVKEGSRPVSRPTSRPASRAASSPRSRPATPAALTLEPRSTSPKPPAEPAAAPEGEASGIAVIDPVSATAPSQKQEDALDLDEL